MCKFCAKYASDVGAAGSVIGACWGDLGDPEYKVARQHLRHCHDQEEARRIIVVNYVKSSLRQMVVVKVIVVVSNLKGLKGSSL